MREIKFDYVVRNIKFDEIHHHIYTLNEIEDHSTMQTYMFSPNGVILARRQYTGLKDKNGVEIYEGDIVRISHPAWTETGVISFEKGSFIFTQNKDYRKDQVIVQLYSTQFEIWELEVIGNIYDNPELLK